MELEEEKKELKQSFFAYPSFFNEPDPLPLIEFCVPMIKKVIVFIYFYPLFLTITKFQVSSSSFDLTCSFD